MSENTAPKQNPVRTLANAVRKHDRKILIITNVITLTAAVTMRSGLAQHNAFLKEQGLFEQFYTVTDEA